MGKTLTHFLGKLGLPPLLCCLCLSGNASGHLNLYQAQPELLKAVEKELLAIHTAGTTPGNAVPDKVLAGQNNEVVTGRVTSGGEPMPGVTVMLKGSSTGAITDGDGKYQITVPNGNGTLVFSFIGYISQEVSVNNRSSVDVSLALDDKTLGEVVVVGYGTEKKRDVTGAISSINEKVIEERQAVNVFEAMQGTAAGVQVSSNSGAPGSEFSITIRGASSFSDAAIQPLFIVDGMIVNSIDGINPNDIKSMEILKDGASAAIYGSRSANGVVIITTKTGAEGKPKVDVRYLTSFSRIANTVPQVNKFERVLNHSSTRGTVLEKYNTNADSVGLIASTSNDYQDLLTRTAIRRDLGLSVSGGTNNLKYFTSLNYIDENGVILTSYNKKATMRTNVDFKATPRLTFGSRLSLSVMETNNISEGDVLGWALKRITDYIVWYPDGSLAPVYAMGGQRNPIQEIEERKRLTNRYEGNFNNYLEYKLADWLRFRTSATGNLYLNRFNEFRGKELDSNGNEDLRQSAGIDRTSLNYTVLSDAYLSADKTFANDHTVTAMVGGSIESGRFDRFHFQGNDFVTESGLSTMNLLTLQASGNPDNGSGTFTFAEDYAIAGLFSRVGYNYKGKYIFNATARMDGSSKFGPNNRWGLFPSASVGWRFSDEGFMSWTNDVLTDGKLRYSLGTNGNDRPLSYYEAETRYTAGNFYGGVNGVSSVNTYGNPDIRWEQTKQSNLGLDLSFLSGRVNFTGDYYVKTTSDLIVPMNLPTHTGYNNMKVNMASIENRGLELSVSAYPIKATKNFSWQTSLNLSKNRNKILDLAREDYVQSNIWYVAAGMPAGNFYGYEANGIYQYDASNAYTTDYSARLTPVVSRDAQGNVIIGQNGQPTVESYLLPNGEAYTGDVKQIKVNGVVARGGDVIWSNLPNSEGAYDDKIDDADRKILGNAQPKWDLGWGNNVKYKNWNLSFNFYARWGGTIYNNFLRGYTSWGGNLHNQHPDYVRTGWKYPGQITDWYWIGNDRNYNYRELSSLYLEDGSFIRLRNVRLTYQLNNSLANRIFMNAANIYVYGNNLLTWTNYSGFDPEIGGGVLTPGRDGATYPRKREIGVGVNLNF
ncbi:SusC/RagA family TonB-linked outer membrane protein [Botryobacter ruber]|uniref:SusC/RagA family TonB-linked outer membrane protein n=1 Tax=Botryobacter ruber TaxID=2171629 RepID=UPI000E0AF9A4|nr:TonB-dependent receptor [Botryobacter ruber]